MKASKIVFVILVILVIGCSKNKEPAMIAPDEGGFEQQNEAEEKAVEAEPALNEGNEEPKLIIAHNGRGSMCLSELQFLEGMKKACPSLIVREYNTDYKDSWSALSELIGKHKQSEGVSAGFEYLPFTFVNNKAYSGFNEGLRQKIRSDIEEICK